jgi:16S rRNA (adenine1518-N6/adenine1519-N6)-dimethyltransferase
MEFRARKRFGQHFLNDSYIIEKIIHAVSPKSDDHIVEIGPGQGVLTQFLIPQAGRVDAIEIDRDLAAYLREHFKNFPQFFLHEMDVLNFNFSSLTEKKASLRVVGNLPYNISTPLLFHLFNYLPLVRDIHVMLQKEVAERMTAKVNTPDYSRLSVMTQFYCQTQKLFDVSPMAFSPPPKVDSSVIRLTPNPSQLYQPKSVTHFAEIVKNTFNFRRKTIRNSLKPYLSEAEIEKLGIDPNKRPQELSIDEFILISDVSSPAPSSRA